MWHVVEGGEGGGGGDGAGGGRGGRWKMVGVRGEGKAE